MGLAKLQTAANANEGRWLHLEHPDHRVPLFADEGDTKERPVRLLLLGKDSKEYIEAERTNRTRSVENIKKRVKYSATEDDALTAETLAKCTRSWENVPQGWLDGTDDETPAAFNYDNAKKLYENPGVSWVREQADDFIGTRANFLKP